MLNTRKDQMILLNYSGISQILLNIVGKKGYFLIVDLPLVEKKGRLKPTFAKNINEIWLWSTNRSLVWAKPQDREGENVEKFFIQG